MAKNKKTARRTPWPLIAAAIFCDKVLAHADGSVSPIRLIDTYYTQGLAPDADPEERVPIRLEGLVAFKSGEVRGQRTLRLIWTTPTGKRRLLMEQELQFKGGEAGINYRFNLLLNIKTEGLWWLDVQINGKRVTRMPLRIIFVQTAPPTDSAPQAG